MNQSAVRTPLLRLPAATLLALHRALAQNRPPAEAAALIREFGYEAGDAFYRAFQDWLQARNEATPLEALPAERFWRHFTAFFTSLGWGELEFESLHPGIAALSSREWAEAESGGEARQPTCHLTTGILADVLSRVSGTDLAVMEVECRSRGDERCCFLLGGSEVLEGVHARMQQGAGYQEALEQLL